MEALLISTGAVAIAEIGDKTQLLAIFLAARFRAPLPIVFGIFAATVLNHTFAAALGVVAGDFLSGEALRWILAVSFLGMAIWTLLPDRLDDLLKVSGKSGAFAATLISFFLLEMGDKTQLATVALAAHYKSIVTVAAGTTAGMLIADVPAVYLGEFAARTIPLKLARMIAAVVFFALALATLVFG
jgi:putative Ca2+/H+ antiporter (TMEM165/GDT1 family)